MSRRLSILSLLALLAASQTAVAQTFVIAKESSPFSGIRSRPTGIPGVGPRSPFFNAAAINHGPLSGIGTFALFSGAEVTLDLMTPEGVFAAVTNHVEPFSVQVVPAPPEVKETPTSRTGVRLGTRQKYITMPEGVKYSGYRPMNFKKNGQDKKKSQKANQLTSRPKPTVPEAAPIPEID